MRSPLDRNSRRDIAKGKFREPRRDLLPLFDLSNGYCPTRLSLALFGLWLRIGAVKPTAAYFGIL